jgi:hypothetical protein
MGHDFVIAAIALSFPIGLGAAPASAQDKVLQERIEAIVKPSLSSCAPTASDVVTTNAPMVSTARVSDAPLEMSRVVPKGSMKEITADRISKTLNGVWHGEVLGDTGDVHVDYFWIMDTVRNEGLIIAQRSGDQTVTSVSQLANPPKLTYLMCSHTGYSPGTNVPQLHQFVKISNSSANAAALIQKATGLKRFKTNPTLAELWQRLVTTGYFDGMPYVAFAGGFFKPLQVASVAGASGPPQISMQWNSEYRGGGSTRLKYMTGVPTVGSEQAQFVPTVSTSGDYLVASPGNGKLWKVEAFPANETVTTNIKRTAAPTNATATVFSENYSQEFDAVTMGPIQ